MRQLVFQLAIVGVVATPNLGAAQRASAAGAAGTIDAQKLDGDLRASIANCRTALETAVPTAPTVCAETVALTERLPTDRRLERRSARRNLASAYYLNKQYADAKVQM